MNRKIAFCIALTVGALKLTTGFSLKPLPYDSIANLFVAEQNFSGNILIAKGGAAVYEKSFGYADFDLKIKNSQQSLFCIGSLTKSFTAVAILLLQEKGLLNVESSIEKYFPAYPYSKDVTLRMLLQHTAGIKREIIDDDAASARLYTTGQLADSVLSSIQNKKPDGAFAYSNGGYLLLARIVELASQTSYAAFVEQNIFRPLGMDHSVVADDNPLNKAVALGYDPAPYPKGVQKTLYENPSQNTGAGNIYSTTGDLLKWSNAYFEKKLLRTDSWESIVNNAYGYGRYTFRGQKVVGHDGIVNGYIASLDNFADKGVAIIVLGNIRTGALNPIRATLTDLTFNGTTSFAYTSTKDKLTLAETRISEYIGNYELFPGFNLTILKDRHHLALKGTGGYPTYLANLPQDNFIYRAMYSTIIFKRNAAGKIESLIWRDLLSGDEYPALKK